MPSGGGGQWVEWVHEPCCGAHLIAHRARRRRRCRRVWQRVVGVHDEVRSGSADRSGSECKSGELHCGGDFVVCVSMCVCVVFVFAFVFCFAFLP